MKSFARRGVITTAGLGTRSSIGTAGNGSRPLLAPMTNGIITSSTAASYHSAGGSGRHPGFWGPDNPAYATTILCVRKGNSVVMVGDGQVTLGSTVVKPNARKVRQIRPGIVAGFAGATADAFTLFERLEEKIEEHQGQLLRSCVDLAKQWRTDKYLRRLEAMMVVADKNISLTLTGTGDVIEPNDGIIAIGSGGTYALACARGMIDMPDIDAETIALKSMKVAADLCIYTNHNFVVERINIDEEESKEKGGSNILSAPDLHKDEP